MQDSNKIIYLFKCCIGKRLKDNKGDLEKVFDEQNLSHLQENLINEGYWVARMYNHIIKHHKVKIVLTYLQQDLQM